MAFVGQTSAAAVLVALTLVFQSAGMAALIRWVRSYLEQGLRRFGTLRSGVLMVRFTSVIIGLHLLQVLLRILSVEMFSIVGISILLLGSQLFDGRLWRSPSAADMADPGSGRRRHRVDVRTLRRIPVRDRNPAD